MPESAPRRRFRISLSLRVLMLLVLVLGGGMGWYAYRARVQREAVAAIEAAGGEVYYDFDWESGEDGLMPRKPRWPKWLVDRLGPDYLGQVITVEFNRRPSEQPDDGVMERVGQLSGLEELDFGVTGPGVPNYFEACRVTDAGLAHLRSLHRLRRLRLQFTSIKGPGLVHLSGLKALKHLEPMYDLTDEGAAALSSLKHLEELSIVTTNLTDDGIAHLAPLTQLKNLALNAPDLTGVGLARLKGWNRLTRLSLSMIDLEDYRFLSQFPELTSLELVLEKFDTKSVPGIWLPVERRGELGLASLGTLSKLRDLSVSSSSYPESLLANIGRVQGLERLTLAPLRNVPTTDFVHLSRLSSLQSLWIENSTLDDSALAHVAGLKRLKNLSLAGNPISDEGLSHFSGLTELETLGLDRTMITDRGLIHLIPLTKCKTLTVANTAVTVNGLSNFRVKQKSP
jgi:internalin A